MEPTILAASIRIPQQNKSFKQFTWKEKIINFHQILVLAAFGYPVQVGVVCINSVTLTESISVHDTCTF